MSQGHEIGEDAEMNMVTGTQYRHNEPNTSWREKVITGWQYSFWLKTCPVSTLLSEFVPKPVALSLETSQPQWWQAKWGEDPVYLATPPVFSQNIYLQTASCITLWECKDTMLTPCYKLLRIKGKHSTLLSLVANLSLKLGTPFKTVWCKWTCVLLTHAR